MINTGERTVKKVIKLIALILSMITILSFAACNTADGGVGSSSGAAEPSSPSESKPESTPKPTESSKPSESQGESTPLATPGESTPLETPEITPPAQDPNDPFYKYRSNIVYGTGNNSMVSSVNGNKPEIATYRMVVPVQETGEFEYSLYFSNNIDSCSNGNRNYPDMPTASYKILYAALRTTIDPKAEISIMEPTELTFDGKKTKTVAPGETFWSDPVTFMVDDGFYLIFEWTVEFTKIPSTIVASTYYTYKSSLYGEDLPEVFTDKIGTVPLPDLIGCTRGDDTRIAFIGDSITMGTGSGAYQNSFWVKQIADRLGNGYSVWNLGNDSARVDDVVTGTSFKEKIKHVDVLSICMGINDIASGVRGQGAASHTDVCNDIAAVAKMAEEAGAKVIIFSIPPFNLTGNKKMTWEMANVMLKELAEEKGYDFFDFAAVLGDPSDPSRCLYGDHPNAEGCTAVADAFMESGILEPKE